MDFRLNDEQLEFQADLPQVRARGDPAGRGQVRPRGERALGGHQGRARVGPPRARPHPADGQRTRTASYSCIYAEELHWGCAGIALAIQGGSLAAAGIASSGTPEQIGRWVPECFGMGDEIKLGAYAVTEAGAGSDVRSLRTTAKQDGDEWVLNGTKVFITNGGIADVTVVVATVDPELGHRGQASFVVPKGTPGLSMGKKESKLGIRASQTAEVVLEDCRIPMEYLLGGYEKLAEEARARPLGPVHGPLLGRARHVRAHPPAGGRLGARHRAGRLRVDARVPRGQVRGRRAAARAAAHPAGARRRGHRDRGRPAARVARRLDGAQRHPDDRRPGLDVEAEGRRHRRCGPPPR